MRLLVFIALLSLVLVAPVSNAAVKAGSTCTKQGIKQISAGKSFTCVKQGKKLVWNKGVSVKKAGPAQADAIPVVTHDISVSGFQWSWKFAYPAAGERAVVTGTEEQAPTLYLPQGQKVRITLSASDVEHGFWIPAFMVQAQASPGQTTQVQFIADKVGEYPGRCNVLCGRSHSQMIFSVKVVTPEQYSSYLDSLR
jgi:heme/copper-type cytochrome/quinol oxidase subunit 2